MSTTQFAHDLRLARRKAGFTQRDVAHLLGTRGSVVSALERGRLKPTLTQIVTLSVIYGRSFESLFAAEMREAEAVLRQRIMWMSEGGIRRASTYNRSASIERLAHYLANSERQHGEA